MTRDFFSREVCERSVEKKVFQSTVSDLFVLFSMPWSDVWRTQNTEVKNN